MAILRLGRTWGGRTALPWPSALNLKHKKNHI